jgi:hypothetical protein
MTSKSRTRVAANTPSRICSKQAARKKPQPKYWFWVWIVMGTVHKERQDDPNALCEVWKNLFILHAHSEREALQKARKIGRAEAGDSRGSLALDGKPAICKFLGISSLGLIHEPLGDGAEICWSLQRCRQSTALKLPTDETTLLAQARKELQPYAEIESQRKLQARTRHHHAGDQRPDL